LWLGKNEIGEISVETFAGNKNLRLIDLSQNKLTHLPSNAFKELSNLLHLYLDHLSLTTIQNDLFLPLTNLQTLWLGSCNIEFLKHDWFDSLTSLQALNLDNNHITSLSSGIFKKLTALKALNLNNNHLSVVQLESFPANLNHLTELHFGHNMINSIEPTFFRGAITLKIVDFTENLCIDEKFDDFSMTRVQNMGKFMTCFANYQATETTTSKKPDPGNSPSTSTTHPTTTDVGNPDQTTNDAGVSHKLDLTKVFSIFTFATLIKYFVL
jgi:Leucine-rich repeat (LRR) protein